MGPVVWESYRALKLPLSWGGFPWLCTAELHDAELCGDTSGCRGEAQEGIGYLRVEGWTTMFRKVTWGCSGLIWARDSDCFLCVCVFFWWFLLLIVLLDLISFFLVGCWRGNMMQWYVYKCIQYIDIFLSVGECEKRQFQWFGQHAQFANWFHLVIWWWSCMWEKCFFSLLAGQWESWCKRRRGHETLLSLVSFLVEGNMCKSEYCNVAVKMHFLDVELVTNPYF